MVSYGGPLLAARRVRSGRGRFGCLFTTGLIFLGSLILGFLIVFPGWHARLGGMQAQGTVVSISDCPQSDSGGGDVALRMYHPLVDIVSNVLPTIQFTDNQGRQQTVDYSTCGDYGEGETVTLWYVPSDPSTIFLAQDMPLLFILTGVMALMDLPFLLAILLVLFPLLGRLAFGAIGAARRGPTILPAFGSMGSVDTGPRNHRVGETVDVDERWAVTLTSAYPSQGNEYARPAPGRFFLILLVTLRNASSQPLDMNSVVFRLVDTAGREYPEALAPEVSVPTGMLQPGNLAFATLAFDLPGTTRQLHLNFYPTIGLPAGATWDVFV